MIMALAFFYFLAAVLAVGTVMYVGMKIVKFFIILANPDNLPGFNLYKTWFKKDK